jgi:hypothetical protein
MKKNRIMDVMTSVEFSEIAEYTSDFCISVYIPTHRGGMETTNGDDSIRLKTSIQEIENNLLKRGVKTDNVKALLQPAKNLVNDSGFWRHQSDGLAIFIADGFFKYLPLPLNFEKFTNIGSKFYVKPLIPLFSDNGLFYILSFSKDAVKFYQATQFTISEVELEDFVPQGMEEALMYDDPTSNLQHHSGSGGKSNAIFHGQGGGKDTMKTDTERYLYMVDEGIMRLIKGEHTPLVLAAVDYMIPMYKGISKYSNIMNEGITGNPEYIEENILHKKSWNIVEPFFRESRKMAIRNFYENPDADLISSDMQKIIPAAFYKQVNQLFLLKDANIWGEFNKEKNRLEIFDKYKEGAGCLLDEAAVQTIINGGEVYIMEKAEMPVKTGPVAAVLRFS